MYKYALANLVEVNTEACETIVDMFCGPEAYTTPGNWVFRQLNFGFVYLIVLDYIEESYYPMLKRSLEEGLNPNQNIETHGSLLGASVLFRCVSCVKMLIESGASVNTPIKYKPTISMEGTSKTASPEGWSPLKLAVADGQARIVKILIENNKISKNDVKIALDTTDQIIDKKSSSEILSILSSFDHMYLKK